MVEDVDQWFGSLDGTAARNGIYRRNLLSVDVKLEILCTRRYCLTVVLKSYACHALEIDRTILTDLGLSTHKVGGLLLALVGRPVSLAAVSRVAGAWPTRSRPSHRYPLATTIRL